MISTLQYLVASYPLSLLPSLLIFSHTLAIASSWYETSETADANTNYPMSNDMDWACLYVTHNSTSI